MDSDSKIAFLGWIVCIFKGILKWIVTPKIAFLGGKLSG